MLFCKPKFFIYAYGINYLLNKYRSLMNNSCSFIHVGVFFIFYFLHCLVRVLIIPLYTNYSTYVHVHSRYTYVYALYINSRACGVYICRLYIYTTELHSIILIPYVLLRWTIELLARWPLTSRRVGTRGREFKPRPGRI